MELKEQQLLSAFEQVIEALESAGLSVECSNFEWPVGQIAFNLSGQSFAIALTRIEPWDPETGTSAILTPVPTDPTEFLP